MHRRSIACASYLRDDGLWEVEAQLVDTKPFTHRAPFRGEIAEGEPVHDMIIRLAIDDKLVIREAQLTMSAVPFPTCVEVERVFERLVGVKVGPGWRKQVQGVIERLETCTHAGELIGPAITTLYQTLSYGKDPVGGNSLEDQRHFKRPPFFLDGCHSWRSDGPIVAQLFPQFASGRTVDAADEGA
jgi:hypothetical protein